MRRTFRYYIAALLVGLSLMALATCSGDSPDPPNEESEMGHSVYTEELVAQSKDSVLFDLKLSFAVADSDRDGSLRDEISVETPDLVEYQGIFADGDTHLLIVSCFADDCQDADKTASFTVRYNRVGG